LTVTEVLTGNAAGIINTYRVTENGREFLLTRKSNAHGSSVGIAGKEGILYVDCDDNRVHRQVVALSGACGLNTDDELVEGLSPWSLRGVRMADQRNEPGVITIISEDSGNCPDKPVIFIDGKAADFVLQTRKERGIIE
jgi:hypothetical protein